MVKLPAMPRILLLSALLAALVSLAGPVPTAMADEVQAREFRAGLTALLKELESGLDEGFTAALDRVCAVKDAADGIDPAETAFIAAAREAAEDVGHELVRKTHSCGQSRIVRIKSEGESEFALVRLDYGDTSWGWADFELAPALDGSMRIVDIVNYSTGLNLVETVRQTAAPMLSKEESVAKLYKIPASKPENAKKLFGLLGKMREGEYADAVQEYYALPDELRAQKEVALLGLQAAALAGNPISHSRIMKELGERLTGDPQLTFMLAEYHFSADEHAQALAGLEAFEKAAGVGKDATIMAMKANALTALGRAGEALALAKKAIAAEPDVQDGHWAALQAQCTGCDYAGAVETAKTLEKKFDYKLDEDALSRSVAYEGFVKSAQYQKWREEVEGE